MEVGYDIINNVNLLHARNIFLAAQNENISPESGCSTPQRPNYNRYMGYPGGMADLAATPTTSRYPANLQQQLYYPNSCGDQQNLIGTPDRWMSTARDNVAGLINHNVQEGEGNADMKVCVVCGDKASGVHYKVMTCEGCKGFWRRTIQRGSAISYRCKSGTNQCPVNIKIRSRCQKCRYTACVNAGMMADLVMSEKERLSRSRLVDQNREKRRGAAGAATEQLTPEDVKVLATIHLVFKKFLCQTQDLDICTLYSRCVQFADTLRNELIRLAETNNSDFINENIIENAPVSYESVFCLFICQSQEPSCFNGVPVLAKLSSYLHASPFPQDYLETALAVLIMRPQLFWPRERPSLAMAAWQLVSSAVKRKFSSPEEKMVYMRLFQCVHSAVSVASSVNISQILESF